MFGLGGRHIPRLLDLALGHVRRHQASRVILPDDTRRCVEARHAHIPRLADGTESVNIAASDGKRLLVPSVQAVPVVVRDHPTARLLRPARWIERERGADLVARRNGLPAVRRLIRGEGKGENVEQNHGRHRDSFHGSVRS